jgi:hypothetical protein
MGGVDKVKNHPHQSGSGHGERRGLPVDENAGPRSWRLCHELRYQPRAFPRHHGIGGLMQRTGDSLFTKEVFLEKSRQYDYKYMANDWRWLWGFADYELDGYGTDFSGRNPAPE